MLGRVFAIIPRPKFPGYVAFRQRAPTTMFAGFKVVRIRAKPMVAMGLICCVSPLLGGHRGS